MRILRAVCSQLAFTSGPSAGVRCQHGILTDGREYGIMIFAGRYRLHDQSALELKPALPPYWLSVHNRPTPTTAAGRLRRRSGRLRSRSRNNVMCESMARVVDFNTVTPARPAWTHPPPCGTPCTCSSGARADRCSLPALLASAPPALVRAPWICSFRAGAGNARNPAHLAVATLALVQQTLRGFFFASASPRLQSGWSKTHRFALLRQPEN